MKKLIFAALIMLAAATAAISCGAPQTIHGRVTTSFGFPVYAAHIQILEEGIWPQTVITNPFGYYESAIVMPCSSYEIRVISKTFTFQTHIVTPPDFPDDGSGVVVDLVGTFN